MNFTALARLLLGSMTVAIIALFSVPGHAAEKETLRVCVGSKAGNYYFAGGEIAKFLGGYKVVPVYTNGAVETMQGLRDGKCDWAFTQGDVYADFIMKNPEMRDSTKRIANLYKEGLHLVCNRAAKVDRITDIPKRHLTISGMTPGGGSLFTFKKLLGADDSLYKSVELSTDDPTTALLDAMDSDEGKCFAMMTGLNAPQISSANGMSVMDGKGKPKLKLVAVDDRDMKKMVDEDGKPLYTFKELSPNTGFFSDGKPLYKNLLDGTTTIPFASAMLVTTNDWKNAHSGGKWMDVMEAVKSALPTIRKRTNPTGQDL